MIQDPIRKYFAMALELGKTTEGTAIAMMERLDPPDSPGPPMAPPAKARYELKGIQRFPPDQGYGQITAKTLELIEEAKGKSQQEHKRSMNFDLSWILDQTAVGKPVVDLVLEKLGHPFAYRVIFAGSHTERESDGLHFISKHLLISEIEALLEEGRLKFSADDTLADDLKEGLLNYKQQSSQTVTPDIDPWRDQPHDDLVLAVGLACRRLKTAGFSYEFI
jgi:hypothetical protein